MGMSGMAHKIDSATIFAAASTHFLISYDNGECVAFKRWTTANKLNIHDCIGNGKYRLSATLLAEIRYRAEIEFDGAWLRGKHFQIITKQKKESGWKG